MRCDDPWETENGQVDTNGEHDIRGQNEDGKTPFSFLERSARNEVRWIEKVDEEESEEWGLGHGKRRAGNNHRDRRHLWVEKTIRNKPTESYTDIL
jgi:hypothetical protein